MKLRCSGLSIILILVSMLSTMGFKGVSESNITDYIESDCVSVADFVEDNFKMFVNEYNKESNESWDASYVENRYTISIDECGIVYDGVFLDFNLDKGYAVVGNNYNLLDFSTKGDSPFKDRSFDKCYFSNTAGYYYLCGEEYFSVHEENNASLDIFENSNNGKAESVHYEGQEKGKTGCGKIENTDKYIADRYGNGWTLSQSKSLPMNALTQSRLSVYTTNKIENDKIQKKTESNCWIVSAYNVLQYLSDTQLINSKLPKSSSYISYIPSISEPNIYSQYFDNQGNNKTDILIYNNGKSWTYAYTLKNTQFNFPELYTKIRTFVNQKYKQINKGGNIWQTSKIIETISKNYNCEIEATEHILWFAYLGKSTQKIDEGFPLLWSTLNCTYGSHTMAVCGYKYYTKTTGWWIFKTTKIKLFYELRDGHTSEPRFFDMTGHTGASTIISLSI